jgi:hypothetical protein
MYINIHNPHRESVEVLRNQNGAFATARYSSQNGGEFTMYFNNPDDLRAEAAALKLLAEALEEEQAK